MQKCDSERERERERPHLKCKDSTFIKIQYIDSKKERKILQTHDIRTKKEKTKLDRLNFFDSLEFVQT